MTEILGDIADEDAAAGPLAKAQADAKRWEDRYWAECNRRSKAEEELRELRAENRRILSELDGVRGHNALLSSDVSRLEGYKQRVERVDDLDRGVPPMERIEIGGPPRGYEPVPDSGVIFRRRR
jgi:chromosome segregation ATPase